MAQRAPRRRCKGKNKAGTRCKAAALKTGNYCRAHDPTLPDATRFGSPEQAGRAGASPKPHVPKVMEAMREQVEARVDEILAPYFDALTSAVMHATHEGEVRPSEHPDLEARQRAAERILDRTYGKPKQLAEVTGADGEAVRMEVIGGQILDDPEAREAARELRERVEAARDKRANGARARD